MKNQCCGAASFYAALAPGKNFYAAKRFINCYICVIFQFLTMCNTIVGTGAFGVGAASRYGSELKMRLLAAPAPQHCEEQGYRLSVLKNYREF
jgi:hypothetical protein